MGAPQEGCQLSCHHGYLAALVGAELLHLRRRSLSCRHDGGQDDARGTAPAGKRNLLYRRYFGHLVIVFSLLPPPPPPGLFFFGVYSGLVSPFLAYIPLKSLRRFKVKYFSYKYHGCHGSQANRGQMSQAASRK